MFILGMHFSHAVAIIQSLVGSIKGVQILYSDKVRNRLEQINVKQNVLIVHHQIHNFDSHFRSH